MTVLDLVKQSLGLSNVIAIGETPSSSVLSDAIISLNMILSTWQNDGLIALTERNTFQATAGSSSYSIGTGETWNMPSPLSIISAFVSSTDSTDSEIKIVNELDYMSISSKLSQGVPYILMYVYGTVTLYYTPDKAYGVTLLTDKQFDVYGSGSTTINLPNGYFPALVYALAAELMQKNVGEVSQYIMNQKNEAMNILRGTNLIKPPLLRYRTPFSNRVYNGETDDI
jgi:hypothetical protein